MEFLWTKYFSHQKRINAKLKCNGFIGTEAFTISCTVFVRVSTVLIKRSMNAEPTDDDTMLSTAEYHMVECVAITGHLLTRGQLRHQAEGQLLPFASIGTSR